MQISQTLKKLANQTNRYHFVQGVQMSAGIFLAIIIAEFLHVQFAPSTGIIALLGIQSTRKDTIKTVFRRVVSFAYTILFVVLISKTIGINNAGFCVVLLLVVPLSVVLHWENTLSINVVILAHFFIQTSAFSMHLILNETLRLLIGVSMALLVTWKTPTGEIAFQKEMEDIESDLREILRRFSSFLMQKEDREEAEEWLNSLDRNIGQGLNHALIHAQNVLKSEAEYYLHYMKMRESQAVLLTDIYREFGEMTSFPASCVPMAECMNYMADTLSVQNPVEIWRFYCDTMKNEMKQQKLPECWDEMNSNSIVFHVMLDLERIVEMKQVFIQSLSEEEKRKHWGKK